MSRPVAESGLQRALLSVVVPVHNEEQVIELCQRRLDAMKHAFIEHGLDCEIVYVNDGSKDRSADILDSFAHTLGNVRVIHLARNFGHQAAVTAGLTASRGDVVAIIDADLQDPPEVLPTFLDKWKEGFQVIYAIRSKRKESVAKRAAYWTFYRLYRAISDLDMPLDSGDFCVLDRSAVNLLNGLPERQRFVRGLRTWIGLKQVGIRYEREARAAGQPSYNIWSLARLAIDGLISFSTAPLRIVTTVGLLCMLLAMGLGVWVIFATVYQMLFGGDIPRGWASLTCLIVFFSSVQLLSLGVIGEYTTRIFLEVKGRPTYLISRVVGDDSRPPSDQHRNTASPAREETQGAPRAK